MRNGYRNVCVPFVVVLLLSLVTTPHVHAQTSQGGSFSGSGQGATTNFRFAEMNELTIVVSILGGVERPGRYEVSRSIDLLSLIALAGGTVPEADLGDIRITRTLRTGLAAERTELKVDLQDLKKVSEASLLLTHGDIIFVDRESGVTLQEVLSYLTTAAVLTTAIVTVINQTKN